MIRDNTAAIDALAGLLALPDGKQQQALNALSEAGTPWSVDVLRMWKAAQLNRRDHFLEWSPELDDEGHEDQHARRPDIGPYRIMNELGSGDTCSVYLASQASPFQRVCALKVLQGTLVVADAERRFIAERETLASLCHPNIAQLYEAGVGEHGELYFAMEYVEGVSITQFCRKAALSEADRIRLFLQVCDAVAYAHRQGVLHRDLKPSNILVTDTSTPEPLAKVIDFGIAKVLRSSPSRELTQSGLLVGTLAYMSPEQLQGDARHVDTRSDVFALGLVLFEILTGEQCFNTEDVLSALPGMSEEALSKKVRAGDLRLDLQAVILRATTHQTEARYESVWDLAADLKRFLSQRPVYARKPTPWYLAAKCISRNRVASAALVAVAAMGVATSMWINRERRERATLAISLADAWLTQALAIGRDIGDSADREPVFRHLLSEAQRLVRTLPGDEQAQMMLAATHSELGYVLLGKRNFASATDHFQASLDIRQELARENPSLARRQELSLALVRLGDSHTAADNTTTGTRLYRQALEIDEQVVARDPDNPSALSNLGWSYERLGARATPPPLKQTLSEKQLAIFLQLHRVNPSLESLRGLSSAWHNLAHAKRDQGLPFANEAHGALEAAEEALCLAPKDRVLIYAQLRAAVAVAEAKATRPEKVAALQEVIAAIEALVASHPEDGDLRALLLGALHRATLAIPADTYDADEQQIRTAILARFDAARRNSP